jgi:hypothetical protein
MMHGELIGIAHRPAACREVIGEQLFLAAKEKPWFITAGVKKSSASEHGRSGKKTEQRRSWKPAPRQRARGQLRTYRIFALTCANEHSRSERGDRGIRV